MKVRDGIVRILLMVIAAVLGILLFIPIVKWFGTNAIWVEVVLRVLSVLIVLHIVNYTNHLSQDVVWIILIILSPIFGTLLYIIIDINAISDQTTKHLKEETKKSEDYFIQNEEVLKEFNETYPDGAGQINYLSKYAKFPVYRNNSFDYYEKGEVGFPTMLEELKKAQKFIFMEYFILEEGQMWNSIVDILEQKVKEGVEVRVLYDDIGSLFTIPAHYDSILEEKGIKCISFNRINPIISIFMNHRDHRKIMVIDGKVAFSGGVNLADEYINVKKVHGDWKDNIIRIKGEAVWSYTLMFLSTWNALRKEDDDYTVFKVKNSLRKTDGYIVPYCDTPLDDENCAQNVYLNIINQAKKYVYIMTPYLIIDNEMAGALILAAKRGVKTCVITPGIPDKKIIYDVTRSNYVNLLKGGVKIYEYTPGFLHSKVMVSDDICCCVGTVNFDYRSLYLHFENSTLLYGSQKVEDVRDDALRCMEVAREVTSYSTPLYKRFIVSIVKIFSPLM